MSSLGLSELGILKWQLVILSPKEKDRSPMPGHKIIIEFRFCVQKKNVHRNVEKKLLKVIYNKLKNLLKLTKNLLKILLLSNSGTLVSFFDVRYIFFLERDDFFARSM